MGAKVGPDAVETVKVGNWRSLFIRISCVRESCQSRRGGNAGMSSSMSQDVVGSTSMQERQETSNGRNRCRDGLDLSNLIRSLGARNDGGHGKGEVGMVTWMKGKGDTFWRVLA